MSLFVTHYQVIGSRINGCYVVEAPSKREANRIVKSIDRDYVRLYSETLDSFLEEMGETEEEFFTGLFHVNYGTEVLRPLKTGDYHLIDSGT